MIHKLWKGWLHFNCPVEHEVAQLAVGRIHVERRAILPIPDPPNWEYRASLRNRNLPARLTTCSTTLKEGCRLDHRCRVLAVLSHVICPCGICYAWGIVFPVPYLFTRRRNRQNPFLRFHCIQCLILFPLGALCNVAQKGWLGNVSAVAFLVILVCYFVALSKAARHEQFRLPLVSALAERLI